MTIQFREENGAPVAAGDSTLVPVSRSLRLELPLPRARAVLVWSRPRAVLLRREGEEERRLPVRDVTRWMQLALLAAGLLGAGWLAARRGLGDGKETRR